MLLLTTDRYPPFSLKRRPGAYNDATLGLWRVRPYAAYSLNA